MGVVLLRFPYLFFIGLYMNDLDEIFMKKVYSL